MQEIYNSILKVGYQLKHASDNAMVLTHAWGYNGFKRMHEVLEDYIGFYCIKIKKEMRDEQELSPPLTQVAFPAYAPIDIKDHAKKWHATITDACRQIADLNVRLMTESGKQSKTMKNYVNCLYKFKEYIVRFIKRAEHCEWMEHDLHVWDDRMHDKMKCTQEKIDALMLKKKWRKK